MAVTAFVLSFFGFLVVPSIVSFILGLIVLIQRKGGKGFAIAALVVSVVSPVLAISAAIAVATGPRLEDARRETAALEMQVIQSALKLYYLKKGSYPEGAAGLQVLVDEQYLERRTDPWGNNYVLVHEGRRAPAIKSYGRDGHEGGHGPDADISSDGLQATMTTQ